MRWVLTAVTWLGATAVALWIAWRTKAGPVLFAVDHRHGVHVGDVAAFCVAWMWATHASAALLVRRAR